MSRAHALQPGRMWLAFLLAALLAACRTTPEPDVPQAVSAARQAYDALHDAPEDAAAMAAYQGALARLGIWLERQPADRQSAALAASGLRLDDHDLGEAGLRYRRAQGVSTRRLERRHTRDGIGLPMVAWRSNDGSGPWDRFLPPEGIYLPATALLEREAGGWVLRMVSPLAHAQATLAGRDWPLAADTTAAFALLLAQPGASELGRTGFFGLFNPQNARRAERVYLMKGYDPSKIPLLTVHGLQSTPLTFANLANDLFADPEFRQRYQLWQYHYPTGMAVLHNATQLRTALRRTLDELDPEGKHFATRNIVTMGHSMGGVITHTLVSDSGSALWDSVVDVPPQALTQCPPEAVEALHANLVFERDPRVVRAIFIAAPHRGSEMADNWIGTLGQRLFHRDQAALGPYSFLLECARDRIDPRFASLLHDGKFSSIRTLSSQSRPVMALSDIPPAVPFHSIIGQRRPGPMETGSDGVVPYSSSHMDGAESELIVPYGHSAFRHPDAVKEILRILHLQAARSPVPAGVAP